MVYTLRFFSLQNAVCFIILTYLVPVSFTFYIQYALKLKKNNNSGAKRLRNQSTTEPILSPNKGFKFAPSLHCVRYTFVYILSETRRK